MRNKVRTKSRADCKHYLKLFFLYFMCMNKQGKMKLQKIVSSWKFFFGKYENQNVAYKH